jgi:hypothetical protein
MWATSAYDVDGAGYVGAFCDKCVEMHTQIKDEKKPVLRNEIEVVLEGMLSALGESE